MNILQMRLQSVSPLDAGSKVELKFAVAEYGAIGELYLRVDSSQAQLHCIDDVYVAQSTRLP